MKRTSILVVVGILLAGAAEAAPVTNGFWHTTEFFQDGTFSGANFAVSGNVGGGGFFISNFNAGMLVLGFGFGPFNAPGGTVQIGSNSCIGFNPPCAAMLTFMFMPNLLPPGTTTADAPFTMTGLLTVGTTTLNIEGSGTLHATHVGSLNDDGVRFDFAVAEPSTLALLALGVVIFPSLRRLLKT